MSETWLPVQLGGNDRWEFTATDDQVAQAARPGPGGDPIPGIGWFPRVPDNELWTYDRISLICTDVDTFVIRLFIDSRGQKDPNIPNDMSAQIGGVWNATPIEVLDGPHSLQVQPGQMLGVTFTALSDVSLRIGWARAQVTRYRRP